jgi:GNAT superfamily N-acetyltransferase
VSQQAQPVTHIRRAAPDDAPAIASVLYRSFVEYEALYTPEAFAATTPGADRVRERMDEGPAWLALQGDTAVATISAVPRGAALYVRSMAVVPAARGQAIGRALLEHVERYAIQSGFERLFLSTTPFLTGAIRLYEQWGFCRSDEGPHDLFGTPLFTMVKPCNVKRKT